MSKNILITGSTDGIGKLAAIQLAKDQHQVFIHGRNAEKVARVTAEIQSTTGNTNIKGYVADFSDLAAVKQMAEEVSSELSHLDILINNAGVFKSAQAKAMGGHDIRFVVNYYAPIVFTEALRPLLQNSAAPRIINLSSAAQSPVSLAALKGHTELSARDAYAQSKLALTMWSFHLAQEMKNAAVIPVNPGSLLNTNMVREAFGQHWSSADKGAQILYDLAVGAAHQQVTGKYFDNDSGAYGPAHADAYKPQIIDDLLATTKEVLASLL